jgi:hypothetical protein
MSEFSEHNNGQTYISSVEVENLQLREALVYAEKGWREALDLARKEQEKGRADENVLEIKSLQLELQSVHKTVLHSRREEDAARERLRASTSSLEDILEELVDCLGYRQHVGVKPSQDNSSAPKDDNLGVHLDKLDQSMKKAETILSFARETHIKRLAKEEAMRKARKKKPTAAPTNDQKADLKPGKSSHSAPKRA